MPKSAEFTVPENEPHKKVNTINKNEALAHQYMHREATTDAELQTLDDIYTRSAESNAIAVERFNVNKPVVKALYMSELLLGNKDSAYDFYLDTIDRLKELPETEKPDLVVLSGLLQGDFKFMRKKSRTAVAKDLESMNMQFKFAHEMIEHAQGIGVPVLYNMSDDDHRINEEYTVVQFRRNKALAAQHEKNLKDIAKGNVKSQADFVPQPIDSGKESNTSMTSWNTVNEAESDESYTSNLRFQNDVIFPWCLRAGRNLLTADKMYEATKDWPQPITIDEYFVVMDIESRRREDGTIERRRLSNSHKRWLRENAEARDNKLIITDDVNLEIKTKGREYTDWIRHSLGSTSTSLPQGFMLPPMQVLGQIAAHGDKTPDMIMTQNNLEHGGIMAGGTFVADTGGMLNTENDYQTTGIVADTTRTRSKQALRSRRRIARPTGTMIERADSGELRISFLNKKLWDKSDSLEERITVAELCDTQIGSISARPDMTAKYLDYIRSRAIGERPTALMFGGDHIHGRNYDSHPIESQQTGGMSILTQKEMFNSLLDSAWGDMARSELKGIERVNISTGNHEYNSGSFRGKQAHGDTFVDYIQYRFGIQFARAGYSDDEIKALVKNHEALLTQTGEYVYGPMAYEKFGDYGMLLKHFYLGRFAKPGGDMPVYQGAKFVNSQGSMFKDIDFMAAGHWHSPQYLESNDKVSYIGGAMAGLTAYEAELGLHGKIAGTLLHLGGGLPPTLEFIPQTTLANYQIKKGAFTNENLKAMGFEDDPDFDAMRDGFYAPEGSRWPKSALQKYIRSQERAISQRVDHMVQL